MYQVDALVSDHHRAHDYSICVDGASITLFAERAGDCERPSITIPRMEFNKLIQWYTKPQKLRAVEEIERSVMRISTEIDNG